MLVLKDSHQGQAMHHKIVIGMDAINTHKGDSLG